MQKRFVERVSSYSITRALNTLDPASRLKLLVIALIQVISSLLDLLGVFALGALGALSIQGIESKTPGNKVSAVLRFLGIQDLTFQHQVEILGSCAMGILIVKTLMSVFYTRKIYKFLSSKSALISANLIERVLSQDLVHLETRSSQDILFIATTGVNSLLIGILATAVVMLSDITMLAIMTTGLIVVDPVIAVFTTLLFFLIGLILYRFMNVRAKQIGLEINQLSVSSNKKIIEVLNSYRESVVRNRRKYYADQIRRSRYELGEISAELNFQPYVSKYVFETAGIIGALALAAFEFGTKTAVHATAVLTVFLAASSRVAPAALRIQQGLLTLRNSAGSADSALKLAEELGPNNEILETVKPTFIYSGFTPHVVVKSLGFTYPNSESETLSNINFEILPGEIVAIVGPSGSGKTTLLDLLLGVLVPDSGEIIISGVSPQEASRKWPGAIAYVPQNIHTSDGSVRENVSQGYEIELATSSRIWRALELARLREFVEKLPSGLDSELGENGSKLSGGQNQRIGIARALFSNPELLVLDEATSSLDGQTENEISNSIQSLSGSVSILIVAHRLSTVRKAHKVIYLEDGKILTIGTFSEIKNRVPNFDKQSDLS